MSRELRISLTAERELDAAYYWYAEHADLATAARFYALAMRDLDELTRRPWTGRERGWTESGLADLRSRALKSFGNYLVFYRVRSDAVEIVRILHGSRDVEQALLDGGEPDVVHDAPAAHEAPYACSVETAWRVAC